MQDLVDKRRIKSLNNKIIGEGPIIYWMSRDQRVADNWALLHAQELAFKNKQPMSVVFCLNPTFLGATLRQYDFMLRGLKEVEKSLQKLQIPFVLLLGAPDKEIVLFANKVKAGAIVTDFDPLKIKKEWKAKIGKALKCHFCEVDAHNIVPCWQASSKLEFGAYTIRPKINRVLEEYLVDFPKVKKQRTKWPYKHAITDWKKAIELLKIDRSVEEIKWIKPGEKEGNKALQKFIRERLNDYANNKNDPNLNGQSNLSPYIHFGQLSAQRIALSVQKSAAKIVSKEDFLEELIVRCELADNYCYYNNYYNSIEGFPKWAQETLNKHRKDKREYVYSLRALELAQTHDQLWNAAELEMVTKGKMHGYLRMYWAKKILEWTKSPEEALKIAIYLNDKYELDGRDPNGYTGIAWSIGGVHDRAWGERKIFGKIRYMSAQGCKNKFDVKKYVKTYEISR